MKKKKWMMMAVMVLALTMMFGTTVYASGKGDVAGAIEGTWQDASAQIKTVVNKVVFSGNRPDTCRILLCKAGYGILRLPKTRTV